MTRLSGSPNMWSCPPLSIIAKPGVSNHSGRVWNRAAQAAGEVAQMELRRMQVPIAGANGAGRESAHACRSHKTISSTPAPVRKAGKVGGHCAKLHLINPVS